MKKAPRGPTWFEDEEFLNLDVSFPDPSSSRWRLERKIYEREYSLAGKDREANAADGENGNTDNGDKGEKEEREERERERGSYEACAVYLCTHIEEPKRAASVDGDERKTEAKVKPERAKPDPRPKKAIMKIRLQYHHPSFLPSKLNEYYLASTNQHQNPLPNHQIRPSHRPRKPSKNIPNDPRNQRDRGPLRAHRSRMHLDARFAGLEAGHARLRRRRAGRIRRVHAHGAAARGAGREFHAGAGEGGEGCPESVFSGGLVVCFRSLFFGLGEVLRVG